MSSVVQPEYEETDSLAQVCIQLDFYELGRIMSQPIIKTAAVTIVFYLPDMM
jgi:hypothetical protein